ncbi:hypothetical protein P3L10_025771 [Capsicum annuum]
MNSPYRVFPDEAILQILARLPVKSVFKTKIVCKLWYRLISDKYFINLYNEISVKNRKVYESELKKWRKFVSLQHEQFTHMNKKQVVFVNGGLHWLADSCSCMVVLDLSNDVWRKIQLPNEISYGVRSQLYLLELDGRLSIILVFQFWTKKKIAGWG